MQDKKFKMFYAGIICFFSYRNSGKICLFQFENDGIWPNHLIFICLFSLKTLVDTLYQYMYFTPVYSTPQYIRHLFFVLEVSDNTGLLYREIILLRLATLSGALNFASARHFSTIFSRLSCQT